MSDQTWDSPGASAGGADPMAVLAGLGDLLQVITRPDFDLADVLRTFTERAVALVGADSGDVAVRAEEGYRVLAVVGMSPDFARAHEGMTFAPGRGTIVGRVLLEGRTIHVHDVLEDPEYTLQDLQRSGGYRTVLAVPMIENGAAIGVLATQRNRVEPFAEAEIEVVTLFASHAALALRTATLLADATTALERERAISQVLGTISRSAFDLDQVLQTVIESAVRLSEGDFGNILRLDEDSGLYRVVAFHGEVDPAYWDLVTHTPYTPDRGTLIGRTLAERQPVHIVDILEDPEYRFWETQRLGQFRTILGVPMLHEGFPIGVFVVWRRIVRAFSDRELALLTTFADQAVLAIRNVHLFQTVERQRAQLARFAPQVAALLATEDGEKLLAGHRREITALFADLRGFTAFAETADPEEVMAVLREYHTAVGEAALAQGGTIEHFAGDGLMVFFNDPTPLPDHVAAAVRAAIDIRARFSELAGRWRKLGYDLGLGIGVAVGYATLGRIGFEGRYDYGGVGNVVILASRLSDVAADREILVSQRAAAMLEDRIPTEPREPMELKGMSRPIVVHAVRIPAAGDGG